MPTPSAELKEKVQELTLARLRALVSLYPTPPHTNRDAYFSPSQWDYDEGRTVRHTLATSASQSMSGEVLRYELNYEIQTL